MSFLRKAMCLSVVSMISTNGICQSNEKDCEVKRKNFKNQLQSTISPVLKAQEKFLQESFVESIISKNSNENEKVEDHLKYTRKLLNDFELKNAFLLTDKSMKTKSEEIEGKKKRINELEHPPQEEKNVAQEVLLGVIKERFPIIKKGEEQLKKSEEDLKKRKDDLRKLAGTGDPKNSKDPREIEKEKLQKEVAEYDSTLVQHNKLKENYNNAIKLKMQFILETKRIPGNQFYQNDINNVAKFDFNFPEATSAEYKIPVKTIGKNGKPLPRELNGKYSLGYDGDNSFTMSHTPTYDSPFMTYLKKDKENLKNIFNQNVIGTNDYTNIKIVSSYDSATDKVNHRFNFDLIRGGDNKIIAEAKNLSEAEFFKKLYPQCIGFDYDKEPNHESSTRQGTNGSKQ